MCHELEIRAKLIVEESREDKIVNRGGGMTFPVHGWCCFMVKDTGSL